MKKRAAAFRLKTRGGGEKENTMENEQQISKTSVPSPFAGSHGGLHAAVRGLCAGAMSVAAAFAAAPDGDAGLAALRALKLDEGTVTQAERDASPAVTAADGSVREGVPPRTVVKMLLSPAQGSRINVEIWLPDAGKWNGRFLGLGNGGSAGRINAMGFIDPLSSGYAVATTDMGTAPNADSGVGNREVWKDFGFRATHLMTVAAKQAVKAYYGRDPQYAYFSGGSTGGQQALQEAQRYPEDYDGIIANIPAHCRTPLHAYFLWNAQILAKRPFTDAQWAAVMAAGNEYMAGRETPATAGKIVSDPRCTPADIEAVVALALAKDPTLTAEHAEALRKLFDGPRHAVTGERIFNGIPFGASYKSACGNLYLFKWVFGAEKNLMEIDFGKDIDTYTAALGPWLNAENADLRPFEARGGKLLMFSGSADECVPYTATLDYYERVVELFGSLEKTRAFFRFYVIPGMEHSLGAGPGVNRLPGTLNFLVAWREQGSVPGPITGRRVVEGATEYALPIYAYPQKTGWDAQSAAFQPVEGARGGVERVAERFRPAAAR